MKTNIVFSLPPSKLRVGILEAEGVEVAASPKEYCEEICADISHILEPNFIYPDQMKKGVRSILRNFGFHPSGRNRPASEFLVKDVTNRGGFNFINNVVDINNHISLKTFLPISVLDLDVTGHDLAIRLGMQDENYVFNKVGQTLSLKNLVVIASRYEGIKAFGSPIKDSQESKIFEKTKNIMVCIYTSANLTPIGELEKYLDNFAKKMVKYTKAERTGFTVMDSV